MRWRVVTGTVLVLVSCGVVALALRVPVGTHAVDPPVPSASAEADAAPSTVAGETSSDGPRVAGSADQDLSRPLIVSAPQEAPDGMVWIPGGMFVMGAEDGPSDEQPRHAVELDGFWMDATEVTNREFLRFTEATGYRTVAERTPKREDFAGQVEDVRLIPEENLVPGSICFDPDFDPRSLRKDNPLWPYQVWKYVRGASWRHPHGPDSSIDELMDHPVVHVAWEDVAAYCRWAGKSLPTEAEWEYAARGGLEQASYPWGDDRQPDGRWMHNIWQGKFPEENEITDGYRFTAAVGTFPPNAWGLYDMSGNVWEWCADWYRPDYYARSPQRNPAGPATSFDPQEPGLPKRVQRGGSFMCSDNYCIGYRCASRMKGTPDSGAFHTGFRCVVRAAEYDRWQAAVQQQQTPGTRTSAAGQPSAQ